MIYLFVKYIGMGFINYWITKPFGGLIGLENEIIILDT